MRTGAVYARAATPWTMLGVTAMSLVVLLSIVARWPSGMWPLHGAGVGLIAATSAWAVDETSARIVDVAPRPLWWRHLARLVTPLVLVGIWTAVHVVVRDRLPDRLGLFALQGLTAAALGFALGGAMRARGHAEPGQWIGAFVAPLALGVAIAKPLDDWVPVFPVWPHDDWARSTAMWVGAAVVAGGLVVATLRRELRRSSR